MQAGYPGAYDTTNPPWSFVSVHADGPVSFEFLGCENTVTDHKDGTGSTDALVRWTGFKAPVTSVDATISFDVELNDQGWTVVGGYVLDRVMCGDTEC